MALPTVSGVPIEPEASISVFSLQYVENIEEISPVESNQPTRDLIPPWGKTKILNDGRFWVSYESSLGAIQNARNPRNPKYPTRAASSSRLRIRPLPPAPPTTTMTSVFRSMLGYGTIISDRVPRSAQPEQSRTLRRGVLATLATCVALGVVYQSFGRNSKAALPQLEAIDASKSNVLPVRAGCIQHV
eukprot:1327091-Amorphochlora_amoeboformis.AAC.2